MRPYYLVFFLALTLALVAPPAFSQTEPQVINIPLSRPGEPMTLEVSVLSARIEVIGEDRADVEFTVSVAKSSRNIITPSGTKAVTGGSLALEIDEEDNEVTFDADWRANKVNVTVRIPRNADLNLSTVNEGEIIVSNVTGNLQLENVNGPITATNISGSVIAEAINETIDVSFARVDASSAMAMTSINGNLLLGLPADAGVQLHIDSSEGEIYSDFEVEVVPTQPVVERKQDRRGIEVRVESVIVADINGGGTIIKMTTLNGDIQIRNSSN